MDITEIRVDVLENPRGKLRAFCSVTLDDIFVVKNFKVIEGKHGLFVAMPSRKLTRPCSECDNRMFRDANYCGRCGHPVEESQGNGSGQNHNQEAHADVAFPIDDEFKEMLENRILDAYNRETSDVVSSSSHHTDENYDFLDFEFEEETEEDEPIDSYEKEEGEKGEESEEIEITDVFSDPQARMRLTPEQRRNRLKKSRSPGTSEQDEAEQQSGTEEEHENPYY